MTSAEITEFRYWAEFVIKLVIGVVVSIVGFDYKNLKTSLNELEENKYHIMMKVEVVQAEMMSMKDRLERIEKKLDRALEK